MMRFIISIPATLFIIAAAFGQNFFVSFPANTLSPLGTNFSGVSPETPQAPFLNAMKTGGGWYTIGSNTDAGSEAYLYSNCLDANGYPTTLTTTTGPCSPASPAGGGSAFTSVSTRVMFEQTFYSGTWVIDFDGSGTVTVSDDGSLLQSCPITGFPNRQIFTSSAAGAGIGVIISATTIGNTVHNIRLTYAPTSTCGNGTTATQDPREVLLEANPSSLPADGETINPDLKTVLAPFKVCRFMDWMVTNGPAQGVGSNQGVWANRPPANWVFWDEGTLNNPAQASGTQYQGVPLEVMVQLANEVPCHPWFNMPIGATDQYVTNFATLACSLLNSSLIPRVEASNELWNTFFPQYNSLQTIAKTAFGGSTGYGGGTIGAFNAQGMLQAHWGLLWKSACGSRTVLSVVGAQASTTPSGDAQLFQTSLWTGTNTPLVYAGTISNGSGGSGNQLVVSSVTTGTVAVGSPVYNANTGAYYGVIIGGSGLNWMISTNQNVTTTFLGGGGLAPGGSAQQYYDRVAIAPYFGYDPPPSWVSSGDGGVSQVFTEMNTGGLIPTGSPVCTTAGTNTAYTVSSNTSSCGSSGSVTCPPADQSILPIKFNATQGTSPTLAVDGCADAYPIEDPPGTAVTGISANEILNVSYMAVDSAWVISPLGYSGGMLTKANSWMAAWSSYLSGLSPAIPMVCYESGQTFTANSTTLTMLTNVNNDARMYAAYLAYYGDWKTNGGETCNHYVDVGTWDDFGFWGALQAVVQSFSYKYVALRNYIIQNPCGWTNCSKGSFFLDRDLPGHPANDDRPVGLDMTG